MSQIPIAPHRRAPTKLHGRLRSKPTGRPPNEVENPVNHRPKTYLRQLNPAQVRAPEKAKKKCAELEKKQELHVLSDRVNSRATPLY